MPKVKPSDKRGFQAPYPKNNQSADWQPFDYIKEIIMRTRKSVSILALSLALGGGMLATPAFADMPKEPGDIRVMDTNKNGKVEKDEYLAYMSKAFDKAAGTKGYCTYEEVKQGFREGYNFNLYGGS